MLILHGFIGSPMVRSSLLTLHALDLDFTLHQVNIVAGDHLQPEYLRLNPVHTVPTLQDGDVTVWDSHAVNAYLADKYGKDDALYPKDLARRARVNQQMFFNCGTMGPALSNVTFAIFKTGAETITDAQIQKIDEAYDSLEKLIADSNYVAGDSLTLADFSTIATTTSMNVFVPVESDKYPKIFGWMARMRQLPYYRKAVQEGLDQFAHYMTSQLAS